MRRALAPLLVLAVLAPFAAAHVRAQEGHPLSGTWSGDWGPSATERHHVTIVMAWDGKSVTGTINPGPDAVPIAAAALNATNWTVHIEAKDIVVDGTIENLGSPHRQLTGTWRQASVTGTFTLTRD
jgi:hypothetical protein